MIMTKTMTTTLCSPCQENHLLGREWGEDDDDGGHGAKVEVEVDVVRLLFRIMGDDDEKGDYHHRIIMRTTSE